MVNQQDPQPQPATPGVSAQQAATSDSDLSPSAPTRQQVPPTPDPNSPQQPYMSKREITLRESVKRVGPYVREWSISDVPADTPSATLKT